MVDVVTANNRHKYRELVDAMHADRKRIFVDSLKWEIVDSQDPRGHTVYELKVQCGLGIMRLQFFTEEELMELQSLIGERLSNRVAASQSR